jgi:3-oxoacyl-[acyl-carrier-protein] synthase-3
MTEYRSDSRSAVPAPGISAVAYALAKESHTMRELAASGELESEPELLERFGFGSVRIAAQETPYELALEAASALLGEGDIDPSSIGALIYCGAPAAISFSTPARAADDARGQCDTRRFRYPATRLQFELGLFRASVVGLDQLACTAILSAVRLARALCIAEGVERVLCVSSDFYPSEAGREAITNCTSDAACAVLVERNATRNRIVGAASVTKGFYWSADAMRDAVMASYFPTALHVMRETVTSAGWKTADVDWILPHNISSVSWEILLRLAALPNARLWNANIARIGHTLAGDNFINLRDAESCGAISSGDRLLMFSYGYGAHWTGLALEA